MNSNEKSTAKRFDRMLKTIAFAALLTFGLIGALAPVVFPGMAIDPTQVLA